MKFLNKTRALCLIPHPDDSAFSMGATIKKYNGTEFTMLYFTPGGYTDSSRGEHRYLEDKNFWKEYGVSNIYFERMPSHIELELSPTSILINTVENLVNIKSFDIIFIPSGIDSNFDHIIVNRLASPLIRFAPITVVEYKCASTLHSWVPNMFVPIEHSQLVDKISSLYSAFPSQIDAPYFNYNNIINFHTDFISAKRGTQYVETFRIDTLYA